MAFPHFPLALRALSTRPKLSLRRKGSAHAHNDLLRAGHEPARQPAFMTVLHGGRPPRF